MNINYLNEELLLKLSQIPLKAISLADGIYKGYHRSKRLGGEIDFREFRKYVQGDDLKKIDWKLSARQDKFFIKEFDEDLNYKIHFILDQSASMSQKANSELSKIEYAKYMLSALAYLFLKQGDNVQVSSFAINFNSIFASTNNIKLLPKLNEDLNRIKALGRSDFSLLIGKTQPIRSEKIVIFIFSDFICDLNILKNTLKKIKTSKNKIILFQLISKEEMDFIFKGEVSFLDPESGETLACNAGQIRDSFINKWDKFLMEFKHWGGDWNMEYRQFNTSIHYSENLLDFIKSYHTLQR
ncbi:MAG: DUF58 domain-containing protein [Spirochaetota bacterium]|nr:DUF58 domain-containing protein [Spirochaetota bacterium]